MLNRFLKIFYVLIFILGLVFFVDNVRASMAGDLFKIDSDSLNSGGSDYTSFGDFQLADTIGEVVIGDSDSASFLIGAGYRQMEEGSISISVSLSDLILTPDLGGISGGNSFGTTNVLVNTDNPSGYYLAISSADTPAMFSADSFIPDYIPIGTDPDYNFVLPVGQAVFGFTPEGDDVTERYRDDGSSSCGIENGGVSQSRCWDGLSSSLKSISWRGFPTPLSGATTTLRFSVGIGATVVQLEGSYWATTTITAISL